jgi:hypothetical protein
MGVTCVPGLELDMGAAWVCSNSFPPNRGARKMALQVGRP